MPAPAVKLTEEELKALKAEQALIEEFPERYPYQCRFQDPLFLQKWTRWQTARNLWRKTWEALPFAQNVPPYFTDEKCPDHPVAREFVAARKEYLADLDWRMAADPG